MRMIIGNLDIYQEATLASFHISKEFNDCRILPIFQWRLNWSSETVVQDCEEDYRLRSVFADYGKNYDYTTHLMYTKLTPDSAAKRIKKFVLLEKNLKFRREENFVSNRICISITRKNIYATVCVAKKLSY